MSKSLSSPTSSSAAAAAAAAAAPKANNLTDFADIANGRLLVEMFKYEIENTKLHAVKCRKIIRLMRTCKAWRTLILKNVKEVGIERGDILRREQKWMKADKFRMECECKRNEVATFASEEIEK